MSLDLDAPVTTGLGVRTRGLVHIYRADGHDVAALSGDLVVQALALAES